MYVSVYKSRSVYREKVENESKPTYILMCTCWYMIHLSPYMHIHIHTRRVAGTRQDARGVWRALPVPSGIPQGTRCVLQPPDAVAFIDITYIRGGGNGLGSVKCEHGLWHHWSASSCRHLFRRQRCLGGAWRGRESRYL